MVRGCPLGEFHLSHESRTKQLGHASPRTTLEDYGQFVPTGADRVMWEQRAGVATVGAGAGDPSARSKSAGA
jgi:hypothetical protein